MAGHCEYRHFEYRHRVTAAETDLCGLADPVNFLSWQGRCRELFLGHLEPDALVDAQGELSLLTLQVECEMFAEVMALDELSVRMRVAGTGHTELSLTFDYVKVAADGEETLVARGGQRIACMRGPESSAVPALIPDALARALAPYSAAGVRPLAGRQK
ncbi:acyl-CoA thioesterase [Streptomyces sp. Da 82-17]|uniref:acyl-CoA thioesterase n=1 Tax=Streptomyces sp. Da 82-17 TaxID=3377116 RepID=UPI0038D50A3D